MRQVSFHKAGVWLSGIGLCLSFFIFIPSLRGLGIGIWPQSETPRRGFCLDAIKEHLFSPVDFQSVFEQNKPARLVRQSQEPRIAVIVIQLCAYIRTDLISDLISCGLICGPV